LCIRSNKKEETQIQLSDTITEILVPPPGKVFLQDLPGLKTLCAFQTDRKPDRNNLACGDIYRTQIARYKHHLRRGCLGTQLNFTDDKSVTAERYFTQSHASSQDAVHLFPLKEFAHSKRGFYTKSSNSSSPAFIALSAPSSDSIIGTCRQSSDGSTCTVEDHRSDVHDHYHDRTVNQKRSTELNKLLSDNPHNIGSWLELVRCQNLEVRNDSLSQGSTPDKVASAVADIQAAILDRALEKNPTSIELKLAQLEVCHGIWEVEKMAAEWKKVVFQHVGDPCVWRSYLRYVRSSFRTFSTSRVTSAYVRAISTLRGARDGTLLSHTAPPLVNNHMIGKYCDYSSVVKLLSKVAEMISAIAVWLLHTYWLRFLFQGRLIYSETRRLRLD